MSRKTFESTPLIDAYMDAVRRHLGQTRGHISTAEALEWLLLDIGMYPENVPASGRLSPVAYSVLADAYAKVGGTPGDLDDPARPYRGALHDRWES